MACRGLRRSAKFWRPAPVGASLGGSTLELHSVGQSTLKQYTLLATEFLDHCERNNLSVDGDGDLDDSMTAFLNLMFFEGRDLALGTKLVFGWQMLFPR